MPSGSPILMYHGVGEPPPRVADEGAYNVTEAELERHLSALSRHRVIALDELLAGQTGVVLTFDDGERSVLTGALPGLAARKLPATVYVSSGLIGQAGYLAPAEVRALVDGGLTVGAHGHSHRMLSDLSETDLADELTRSRGVLGDLVGRPIAHMSLPGGRGGPRVIAAARAAGFQSVSTSRAGLNRPGADPYALPRMPVMRGIPDPGFEALCAGQPTYYARAIARERTLGLAKQVLGTTGYNALRGLARRVMGGS